jgi:Protein of unknown function (DUF998)
MTASRETRQVTTPQHHAISVPAAFLSIVAAAVALLSLASLHVLSPEFDPSWRVVSEYANGQYGRVLSLMFVAWGISSWALAFAIRAQLKTTAGQLGLGFLVAAGLGQAMASVCDINHPLHLLAGMLGVFGLPIAATLISVMLGRIQAWSGAKRLLLWTGNSTWVILVIMIAALMVMIVGRTRCRTIALVGYPNRLLVVLDCAWTMTVAGQAIQLRHRGNRAPQAMSGPRAEWQ